VRKTIEPTQNVRKVAERHRRLTPIGGHRSKLKVGDCQSSTRDPLANLGLAPPAVVLNGALAVDLGTGDRFHTWHYSATDAVMILAAGVGSRVLIETAGPDEVEAMTAVTRLINERFGEP